MRLLLSQRLVTAITFVFLLLVGIPYAKSQSTGKPDPVAAFLQTMAVQHRFNGGVVAFKDGNLLHKQAYGKADFRTGQVIQFNTLFNLGEASQAFTAVAVLKLVETGKLNLEAPITDYLPELPYKDIQLAHLLSHTSGLPDYESLFSIYRTEAGRPTNTDLVLLLQQRTPNTRFRPGKRAEYSSTNFALLATIVARAEGKPFDQALSTLVFQPAGLPHATVWQPTGNETLPNRAYGFRAHVLKPAELDESDQANQIVGAKNLLVSLEDLVAWHTAFVNGELLKPATFQLLETPFKLLDGSNGSYSLGFQVARNGGKTAFLEQDASYGGFRVYFRLSISGKEAFYIVSNARFQGIFQLGDALAKGMDTGTYTVPPIPVSSLMAYTLLEKDVNAAIGAYKNAKKNAPNGYVFLESELNTLGYELLALNRVDDAIAIFELNLQEYPRSFNVYDSLAEAYARKGKADEAIKLYKRSLELYPENENARQMLRKLSGSN